MKNEDLFTPEALESIRSGIPEDELFTPIHNGVRLQMRIKGGAEFTRGPGFKGTVTDDLTGKRWDVYGRECGLPNCFCDAEVKEPA